MTLKERLIPIEEIEYLCVWAWKRRTGWIGGYAANLSSKFKGRISKWENRSIVVCGTSLSYYETGNEDGTPRGTIDIVEDNASFQICKPERDAPSQHQVVINTEPPPLSPTHSVDDEMEPAKQPVEWKFCFDEQQDLMRFVEILNRILDNAGKFKQQDTSRFEHQFQAGDHIYRWEMIVCPPVIYPIQIHGIVLEAGSNCLIVADFGLTGYSRKKGKDFNHTSDEDHHNNAVIMASFRKLRPNDVTQRLHIVTLTDPKQIRKWIKAGYDEESMLAKAKAAHGGKHHFGSLSKVFSRNKSKKQTKKDKDDDETADSTENTSPTSERRRSSKDTMKSVTKAIRTTLPWTSSAEDQDQKVSQERQSEEDNDDDYDLPTIEVTSSTEEDDNTASNSTNTVPMKNTTTTEQEVNKNEEQDDDVDVDDDESSKRINKDKQQQLSNELPHSDPKEIVLARANFVLEHMEVLPPYHVFFSNSECIAVWCKTGHWCTLQTAVWCGTNSVAAAKTSTLTAIGVAAANPLLAPVVAVGGLVWVSAPMVILQKSRVKWEEATKKMTELFWEWAPPIVFVSAIENWAGMSLTTNAEDEEEDETNNNDDDEIGDVKEENDDENVKKTKQEERNNIMANSEDGQVVEKEEEDEVGQQDTVVAGDGDSENINGVVQNGTGPEEKGEVRGTPTIMSI